MNRRGIVLAALLIVLALVSAACGSESETPANESQDSGAQSTEADAEETTEADAEESEGSGEATYVASEFAFEGPDVLPAGEVTMAMDNQGKQMHELALGELLEGKTMEDVHALLKKGMPKKPPTWFREVSGTGAKPGEVGEMEVELTPGNYIMLCFVPDKDSKTPHVMLGMMKEVTVQ
jgi:uncharacterized cupredoxin-like copper-binding protein